jgi:putative membrane protein
MSIILSLLINAVAVFATGYILPGIHIQNFWTAIIIAIVLAVLNTFLKPILTILTLPITILTLGLFVLVINAVIVLIASAIVPGFHVDNFLWAIAFAIILSLVSSVLNNLVK